MPDFPGYYPAPVGSVTTNFQSEAPLTKAAAAALNMALTQAWSDPAKLPANSRAARILLDEAKNTYASHLGLRVEYINFIGEVGYGYFLGIQGLLTPERTLIHSRIDRQEVHAIGRDHNSKVLPVSKLGEIEKPTPASNQVLAWQLRNGETGISQPELIDDQSLIFVDATASGARAPLPKNWAVALYDARAWDGPQGLGIIAIKDEANWNNPIPRIDNRKVPDNTSLPLIIAGAIALEQWVEGERAMKAQMTSLATEIRKFISEQIGEVNVLPGPHDLISVSFNGVDAEYLVTELDRLGFAVDSGSACKPTALAPSHVLEAMSQPTNGNLRIYLHHDTTPKQVQEFLTALKTVVEKFRN